MMALCVIGIPFAVILVLIHASYKRMSRREYVDRSEEVFAAYLWFWEAIGIMVGVGFISVVIILITALCTQ